MDTILNEKKKQYNTLIYRKAEIFKSLKDKTVDLQSKGGEIQELIEKAKVGSDASTLELLRRWEDANNDVLKKNEEQNFDIEIPPPVDTTINQSMMSEKQKKKKDGGKEKQKKKKPPVDPEIERIMAEMKEKDEQKMADDKARKEKEKLEKKEAAEKEA